jgi:FMN reductase
MSMTRKPLVVGVGGTLRTGSSTELAIQVCLAESQRAGAETVFLGGADIVFPHYNPHETFRTIEAKRFVDLLRQCDGLIIGSPGYHGSISGLVKNALDYAEDLRDDTRVYLERRAVGCVACGAGWQTIGSTLAALRSIIHALRGWPTPMGAGVNTSTKIFDKDGRCTDQAGEQQLKIVGRQVAEFASAFGLSNVTHLQIEAAE